MTYMARRYRVKDGKLEKNFSGDQEGWYKSKAEAFAAVSAPAPEAAPAPVAESAPEVEDAPEEETPKRGPGRPRKEPVE